MTPARKRRPRACQVPVCRRPRWVAAAVVGCIAVGGCIALAGCGGSTTAATANTGSTTAPATSAPSTALSTTTTVAPTTSTTGGGTDGPLTDRLPTLPTPSHPTVLPNPSTSVGQRQFVTQVFNDVQTTWANVFATAGVPYRPARLVLFSSGVGTACGTQSADVGPFYCPGDATVYLDLRFFNNLQQRLGVTGDFSQAYVIAHEMGHHLQNVLGIAARVQAADRVNPAGANALSVRVELQADCLAGVWAHSTYTRNLLEPGDVDEALNAAAAVGDDFIQQAAGHQVEPEQWTHGSSAQRQQWFTTGYESGDAMSCDTFANSV
jgi:predicted metalloprotease